MPAVIQLLKRLTTKNTYNFIGRGVPTKIGLFLKQRVYILKFTIFLRECWLLQQFIYLHMTSDSSLSHSSNLIHKDMFKLPKTDEWPLDYRSSFSPIEHHPMLFYFIFHETKNIPPPKKKIATKRSVCVFN